MGPFQLPPDWKPALREARTRRLRSLGRWARQHRWYVDGMLQPVPVWRDDGRSYSAAQVATLPSWQLGKPLRGAYLARPLGEIVLDGVDDFGAIMARIEAGTLHRIELVLDVEKRPSRASVGEALGIPGFEPSFPITVYDQGPAVCRRLTFLPLQRGGFVSGTPRVSVADLAPNLVGTVEEPARPRPLARIAERAARVYLDGPRYGAERRVAEEFGWRTPDVRGKPLTWRHDDKGRHRVRNVLDAAEALGYLPPDVRRPATRVKS